MFDSIKVNVLYVSKMICEFALNQSGWIFFRVLIKKYLLSMKKDFLNFQNENLIKHCLPTCNNLKILRLMFKRTETRRPAKLLKQLLIFKVLLYNVEFKYTFDLIPYRFTLLFSNSISGIV